MAKETVTIDGVKLSIDPEIFSDWDVYQAMTDFVRIQQKIEKEERVATQKESMRQAEIMAQLVVDIFGDDFDDIKDQIRKEHNGRVPVRVVMDLVSKAAVELAPKNF